MNSSALQLPHIPAAAPFDQSALVYAHQIGINAVELDAMALVISRLARDESTVAPMLLQEDLLSLQELGYVDLEHTHHGTLAVTRQGPAGLLSAYFWSVWIPGHLLERSLKVTVLPCLDAHAGAVEAQHCTVVFRIPGTREAAREFLTELATRYPGHSPEIVAVQAGDALSQEGTR
ncbi:hypothetical protein [Pseudomonas lopnurensis]|uniref:hypothetical protein n=1 Tax=Pseudomonas lopnurensis TaxID=1477517 RepID=UPI0028AB139B|nr:hypothetical protein [Pseudomonas lopnurensis]